LPRGAARNALRAAVGAGIRGGALYDALIAATAAHHAHRLLSADRRAATTYAALGLDVVYVTA
jgi:predicted nucleic acid-binding protein